MKKNLTIIVLLLLSVGTLMAQTFSLTGTNPTYSQNFNTLPTATGTAWVNNSTIPNWYSNFNSNILVGAGAGTTGGLYSYGAASNNERALGSLASNATTLIEFGVGFTNNASTPITSFVITFRGEQWRNGGSANTQKLAFFYKIGASTLDETGYEAVSLIDFNSPIATATAAALDGNAATNSATLMHNCTVNIPVGSTVFFKWQDVNDSGGDHGMGIDDLSVTFNNQVMPVELVSFSAKNMGENVLTIWETATEINNAYFDVERSQDGVSFEKIGKINGKGTTNQRQFYQFEDAEPAQGTNYYRLRQVDFDGKNELSKTVSVSFGSASEKVKIYPTLVENSINVEFEGQSSSEILVRDIAGRVLLRKKLSKESQNTEGVQTQRFDVNSLTSGTYFLSVLTSRGVETLKFQKL